MESLVDFIPLAAALAIPVKFVDWLKYFKAKDTNGVVTQLLVWIVGVLAVWPNRS